MINAAMTLRELIGKYTLAEIMPLLKGHSRNEPADTEHYLYMQAWSELQYLSQLAPEEMARLYQRDLSDIIALQEPIRVHWATDSADEPPYISAYDCEGDYWTSLIEREVVTEIDIDAPSALATILWHLTFWGFSDYKRTYPFEATHPDTCYNLAAIALRMKQHKWETNIIIMARKEGERTEILYQGSKVLFDTYPRRSRIKCKRFARIERRIEALERMDELSGRIDVLVANSTTSAQELEFLYGSRSHWYDFQTRAYDRATRLDYALEQLALLKPHLSKADGWIVRISTHEYDDLSVIECERLSAELSAYAPEGLKLIFGKGHEIYPEELSFSLIAYTDRGLKPRPRRKPGLCSSPYPARLAHCIERGKKRENLKT